MAWGLEKDREIERERRIDRKIKRESPRETQTDSATITQTHRQSYIQKRGVGKGRGREGLNWLFRKRPTEILCKRERTDSSLEKANERNSRKNVLSSAVLDA